MCCCLCTRPPPGFPPSPIPLLPPTPPAGLDVETGAPKDLSQDHITDVYATKWWAIKLVTDAVVTLLKVDQIIMAKQAGGPKPRGADGDDD